MELRKESWMLLKELQVGGNASQPLVNEFRVQVNESSMRVNESWLLVNESPNVHLSVSSPH